MSPVDWDFRLTVKGLMNDATYSVEFDSCVPGAPIACVASCPFDSTQGPKDVLSSLHHYTTGGWPREKQDQLVSLGNTLADLLLPAGIRGAFLAHLQASSPHPITLRLRILHRDLAALPWEFLRLEAASHIVPNGWLFQNDRITLRREYGNVAPVPHLQTNKLRVLIAWANPNSARFPNLSHLSAEVEALHSVLRRQGVHKVTELHDATPEKLCRKIQQIHPHLLHFIGHGRQRGSKNQILLSGMTPRSEAPLDAEELVSWLDETTIRLVTLSACDTLGFARILADGGVPAVVAMQGPLADDLAVPFVQNFYTALLQPCPVATAVARARSTLRGSGPAWGVPTLVQSIASDTLFTQAEAPFYVPLARNPEFIEPRNLLAKMHRALSTAENIPITLFGMGGVGKTQAAAAYAYAYQEAYPGGIFWVTASTAQGIIEELGRIGRLHFALPEEYTPKEAALYLQEKLQNLDKPALLLYDNVTWENDGNPAERTEPELYFPVRGPCRVLLTTRDRLLSPPQAHIFEQELTLDKEEALALLTQCRSLSPSELLEAEEVLTLTGALPLALVLAAHHIKRSRTRIRQYLESLERSRIDTLSQSRRGFLSTTKHNGMIFNTIAISYGAQEAPHRSLLAVLACFNRQSICPDLAFRASGFANGMAFNNALADLEDCALLRREEDGRLTLHELVRVFLLGVQTPEQLRTAAGAVADQLTDQMRQSNETMQWRKIRRDLPHCRAVMQVCRQQGVMRPLIDLQLAYAEYLAEHRELAAAQECCLEGIALTEVDDEYRLPLAHFWRIYGEMRLALGESDSYDAVAKASAIAAQALRSEDPEMWHFHNTKGLVHKTSGRPLEALPCYETALTLCRLAFGGDDERVALILNNIAALQEQGEDFEEALQNYRHSLAIYSSKYGIGHSKTAVRLNAIGRVLYALGQFEAARQHHAEAFEIHAATYEPGNINVLMSQIYYAFACCSLHRYEEAEEAHDAAMEGLRTIYGDTHPSYLRLQAKWQQLTEQIAENPS